MNKIPIIAGIIICSLLTLSSIPILQNNSIPTQEHKADFLFLQKEMPQIVITDKNHTIEFIGEFDKVKIELTEIKSPVTIMAEAMKIQPPTNKRFEFTTPVVAIDGNIKFKTAKVTLPIKGKIDAIFKCTEFDIIKSECLGEWEKTEIQFNHTYIKTLIENTGDNNFDPKTYEITPAIVFNTTSFSAYGGGVIVIIKAEHLDQNREFISDIYNEVRKKDNNWSETIHPNEYVRVTFAEKLEQKNDITVFARTKDGKAEIEIYRKDDDTLVAKIEDINEEGWYKVFLDGLGEEEKVDEFDLKVVGNRIEIDYIVDPAFDDFEDGDYTANPTWTVLQDEGGTITVVAGLSYVLLQLKDTERFSLTVATKPDGSVVFVVKLP